MIDDLCESSIRIKIQMYISRYLALVPCMHATIILFTYSLWDCTGIHGITSLSGETSLSGFDTSHEFGHKTSYRLVYRGLDSVYRNNVQLRRWHQCLNILPNDTYMYCIYSNIMHATDIDRQWSIFNQANGWSWYFINVHSIPII